MQILRQLFSLLAGHPACVAILVSIDRLGLIKVLILIRYWGCWACNYGHNWLLVVDLTWVVLMYVYITAGVSLESLWWWKHMVTSLVYHSALAGLSQEGRYFPSGPSGQCIPLIYLLKTCKYCSNVALNYLSKWFL